MPFYFGLDLGQTTDPSAAIILEAHGDGDERTYDVRHIEQFQLGTSYPAMVQAAGATLDWEPLAGDCTLAIDYTSVGRPIYEMFLAAHREPIGITITGGTSWHIDPDNRYQWYAAKILLVATVQKFLQSGRLRIGARLPHVGTLQKELRDFRVKISKAANETYESREGAHDDLVLALAIALFVAENQGPPAAGLSSDDMEELWRQEDAAGTREPERREIRRIWGSRPGYW